MRRGLAWLVAAPLLIGGSQAAHALAYRLAYPDAPSRGGALFATGHGYLDRLPLALGIAAAVGLVSLVVSAADAARGRRSRPLPAWAFATLPPLAFAAQEILERSLHTGSFAWQALLAPTFVPGLLLQLPFGVASWLAARFLLRAAERIGRALAPLPAARRRSTRIASPTGGTPVLRLHARHRSERGPPRIVVAG